MKGLFYIFAVLGAAGLVNSDCPKLEPVSGFEDHDLLQDWALLAHTDKSDPSFQKLICEDMYAYKEGSAYHLTGNGIEIGSNTKSSNWTENGEMKETPGLFYFVNPKYGNFYLTVVGKTSHAVVLYSCEFPFKDTPYVWIYHSDHKSNFEKLPAAEKTELTNILTKNGIQTSSIKFHDNSDC